MPISNKSRDTSEFNSTGQPKLVTLVDEGGLRKPPLLSSERVGIFSCGFHQTVGHPSGTSTT